MKYVYKIEGSKIKSEMDFHKQISSILGFPDYYGNNLDAFWDCLSDCASDWRDDDNVKFIWEDHIISKKAMGEKDFNIIKEIFYRAKNFSNNLGIHLIFELN